MVESPPANAGNKDPIPGPGRSHTRGERPLVELYLEPGGFSEERPPQ